MPFMPGSGSVHIDDCDLLVCSTDKFVAESMVTIGQLKRLGIASMFRCFLLLGDLNPETEGFNVLNRHAAGSWSSELRDGLKQLERPYVLLWLDDFVPLDTAPLS